MQLKIWHKMIIGISIPSLIAVVGGILTYGYINDVKNRQAYIEIADDLKESVLEVRRNERNFLQYKNGDHHKLIHISLSELTTSLMGVSAGTAEQMGGGGIILLQSAMLKYSDKADNLFDSYNNEQQVINSAKAEGEKLEAIVSRKRIAKELTPSFILKLRLLEKNYIFYRDRQSYLEMSKGLSLIKNMTPMCLDCKPYMKSINRLFDAYRASDTLVSDLNLVGSEMEEVTGRLSFMERQKINSFVDRTQNLLLAALALLCVLGPLFVFKTSKRIVAPIKRLAEITLKIAGGDISLRAPIKEHDETQSLAISFNTMLDNLQETQQSLKESLELLNQKQAQLVESEKRASLGFLVAGVAHELNNPLNNITLTAETMSEDLKELSPEELNDYIKDILMQSRRAHTIVENLLDFASARKSTVMEIQDITRIVNDSINLVANQLRVNNIKLVTELPEKSFYVNGNRSKLEQVLISIFTNAMQAMKDTGTLSVKVQPDTDNKNIQIHIRDTGHGIKESDIKNIFEPFYTTKPLGEGTGLGLSISNTLISEHKGDICIKSKMGEWTAFTVSVPLYEEMAASHKEVAS